MAADVIEFPANEPKERVEEQTPIETIQITGAFLETFTQDHGLTKLSRMNGLPTKVAYWVSRLLDKIGQEAKIYAKERQALVMDCCDKDEEGKPIPAGDGQVRLTDGREKFMQEMNELLNTNIDLEGYRKITIELKAIPDGVLSAADILSLTTFINFVDDAT